MEDILAKTRALLTQMGDEEVKKSSEHFFKETVRFYGIRSADVHRLSRELLKEIKDRSRENIYALCTELWKSGIMEESIIACNWSLSVKKSFQPDDIKIFEGWINNYVSNWASCDTLCNHTVGEFVMKYPMALDNLKKWTGSSNRWMKRASAVSLIIPARNGLFLEDILMIAERLLHDKDDMVQKGYGWMLKAASESNLKEVFEFVMKNKDTMPRTSLRYAIEKMPQDMKAKAMKK